MNKKTGGLFCPNCRGMEQMSLVNAPYCKRSFKIPFTDYHIELWDYGNMEYYCFYCENEKYQKPLDEAYLQGRDDGDEEGIGVL